MHHRATDGPPCRPHGAHYVRASIALRASAISSEVSIRRDICGCLSSGGAREDLRQTVLLGLASCSAPQCHQRRPSVVRRRGGAAWKAQDVDSGWTFVAQALELPAWRRHDDSKAQDHE